MGKKSSDEAQLQADISSQVDTENIYEGLTDLFNEETENQFDKMPDEMLTKVLSFLPAHDLVNATGVSRRWWAVGNDNYVWRDTAKLEGINLTSDNALADPEEEPDVRKEVIDAIKKENKRMRDSYPSSILEALGGADSVRRLPEYTRSDWHQSHYINWLQPYEVPNVIMRGEDNFKRPLITFKLQYCESDTGKPLGDPKVMVLYQLCANIKSVWASGRDTNSLHGIFTTLFHDDESGNLKHIKKILQGEPFASRYSGFVKGSKTTTPGIPTFRLAK